MRTTIRSTAFYLCAFSLHGYLPAHAGTLAVPPRHSTILTSAASGFDQKLELWSEESRFAPRDDGWGPNIAAAAPRSPRHLGATAASLAGSQGMFGAAFGWPIIAIHTALLPDGRVMSFGTDSNGFHTGQMVYDVWTPALGATPGAHLLLANTTGADFFCSSQTLLPANGQLLIADGNLITARDHFGSQNHVAAFSPASDQLSSLGPTNLARWYASIVNMPNGSTVLIGGRTEQGKAAATPEIATAGIGWQLLSGADSRSAFDYMADGWYYPRSVVAPDGSIFVVATTGLYRLSVTPPGSLIEYRQTLPAPSHALPSVLMAGGNLLSLQNDGSAVTININGPTPVITKVGNPSQLRYWANATDLADGTVLISGGSLIENERVGVAYNAEIFNPATGQFTLAAAAAKPRLYHSSALLLPDATVLTAGGGAPGPILEFNAEIFYPPYFFLTDGSGAFAPRPSLSGAPPSANLGQTITASVGASDSISVVNFVRAGASTHGWNGDQRFFSLPFTQNGTALSVTLPSDSNIFVPGYYMMFAFNSAGVPSIAQMIQIPN